MKALFALSLLLRLAAAQAQLTVQSGASLHLTGNALLTLKNMSFQNDGQFFPDSSTVLFNGATANRSIGGSGNISFYELHIDRATGLDVVLQSPISVGNRINFITGNLFIGNHDVTLGRTGVLQNESEFDRVRTTGTGRVIAVRTINGGVNQMPGNLGVSITTTENLGDVIVRRGHLAQTGTGLPNSIQRYYEIEPQFTPPNAAATLRLAYFDAELNGLNENGLSVYQLASNGNWNNIGFTLRETTEDYVERNAVPSFGRFTLAGPSGPLPVQFVNLSGRCESGKTIVSWQTAQEVNSLEFDVQRSNGGAWTSLGTVPSAGNSQTLRSYSFTDANPLPEALYRVAERSVDGKLQYSAVLRPFCGGTNSLRLYPNPARSHVFVQVQSAIAQRLHLQLLDVRGAVVKAQWVTVQSGSNVVSFDIAVLPAGAYTLRAVSATGQPLLSASLMKQ